MKPITKLTGAWHWLDPWPAAVEGLTRLKRHHPIVTLSNGNVALILDMARRAGLPWDAVLGAEFSRTYKPLPEAYLATSRALVLQPDELCLVPPITATSLRQPLVVLIAHAGARRPASTAPNPISGGQ